MNERFAELIAKGKAGGLTAAETEELARLLNGPILDSLDNPPLGFASGRSFAPRDIPSRLRTIDWFSRWASRCRSSSRCQSCRYRGGQRLASYYGVWENVNRGSEPPRALAAGDRQNYRCGTNWSAGSGVGASTR